MSVCKSLGLESCIKNLLPAVLVRKNLRFGPRRGEIQKEGNAVRCTVNIYSCYSRVLTNTLLLLAQVGWLADIRLF